MRHCGRLYVNRKLEAFRKAKPENVRAIRYRSTLRASGAAVEDARQRLLPRLLAGAKNARGRSRRLPD